MSRLITLAATSALAALVLSASPVWAGPQAQAPDQAQAQVQQQTARGELEAVDPEAKTLMVKPAEGASMRFQFTDETRITGSRNDAAGLATMTGQQVTVQYRMEGQNRVATTIELQPRNE
ncbi:MAG: hypothetical protein AB7G23_09495 [Vicinamibacterales bacterium]